VLCIDSLHLQVISSGISILDARGNKFYTGFFKNNKKIGEYKILDLDQINKFSRTKKMSIIKDYESANVFENLIIHLKDFKKLENDNIKPMYIKPAVTK
jgi:tRNA A37 threonylcarbamoyladenosine modification protein TsaB